MNKFYEENCLLQQEFVKDNSMTVEKYIASAAKALGGSVKFVDAVRFAKGEGIEKKEEDFAAEVAAQMTWASKPSKQFNTETTVDFSAVVLLYSERQKKIRLSFLLYYNLILAES